MQRSGIQSFLFMLQVSNMKGSASETGIKSVQEVVKRKKMGFCLLGEIEVV